MWEQNVLHFEHPGAGKNECGDVFFMTTGEGGTIVCLADGVSGTRFGKKGASQMEKELAVCLADFLKKEEKTERDLKNLVCGTVRRVIYEMAEKAKCSLKEFASTMMIVLIPDTGGEIWTVHIGDGMIFLMTEEKEIRILSYPHYGILRQYTYTTANRDLEKRIYVKKHRGFGWIMGMTDGPYNEMMRNSQFFKEHYKKMLSQGDFYGLEKRLLDAGLQDDMSFFAVSVEKKEGGGEDETYFCNKNH